MPKHRHPLDAGVEASGPHDFAVRLTRVRLVARETSTASCAQRFVTMAKRPSCGHGMRGKVLVICPTPQAKMPAAHWHGGQISCAFEESLKQRCQHLNSTVIASASE